MHDISYVLKRSAQKYFRHFGDDLQAKCLIIASLSEELKKLHERIDTSCAMVDSLHNMHDIKTSNVFSNVCSLLNAKMTKGTSVHKNMDKRWKGSFKILRV
ncbi:hypothetical protein EV2_000012 [Malus domestica]